MQPNYGWAINNDTGDGWDMLSSDFFDLAEEFGATTAAELEALGLSAEEFRPSLNAGSL